MSDDALRRRRGGTPGPKKAPASPASPAAAGPVKPPVKGQPTWWNAQPEDRRWNLILAVFLCFGIATRFWKISLPHEVVFDEVHFGKFASYYLRGTYFFDVHPPFGKLMIAGVGWLAGYRGHFEFENIGDDYLKHNVPYVALRSLSAILGGLLVPLVVDFGRRLGFGMGASVLAGAMVLFDNALITQSRLILLDSMLIFNSTFAAYCFVRFHNLRYQSYTRAWWGWLCMTGFMLAAAAGIKMVGFLTVALVGVATLVDLWRLLDWRRGLSINAFFGQFFARAFGLIAVPIFFYLLWFYIHFAALYRSGPGDAFMSHRFQAELKGGAALMNSFPVPYYTNVSFRHQLTSVFLHSHPDRYPLRYDDGRVSSAGQQVTGYPHKDANNIFILEPADPTLYPNATRIHPDDARTGVRFLRNGDIFRMLHVLTNSRLITHDVASPLMSTHMEVTTIPVEDDPRRYEETLWRVEAENLRAGERIRSIGQYLKIVNVVHRVAIHTHTGALPAWAFGQQEINGNKNMQERANMWFVEDVQVEYDEETPGGSFFAQAAEDMDYDPIEGLETDLPEEMVDEGEEEWKPDEDNEYDPKTLVHTPATATGAPVPRGTVAPPPPQIAIHDEQPDPLAITLRSNIFLKHLRTNGYLHSHKDRYPLRYEDGRVSSQGQQVTGYSHKDDPNNQWTVIPVDPPFPNSPGWHPNDVKGGKRHLRDGDLVRLLHVLSDAYLVTHDVASPSMKTNMEVTLISGEAAQKRFGETVWRVEIIPERANAAGKPAPWKSTRRRVLKGGEQKIRFINVIHKVALYSHPKVLPQWGFGQFEVNGNKEVQDAGLNEWSIDTAFPIVDNPNDPMDKPMETVPVVAPGSTIKRVRIKKSALKEPDLLEARKVPKMGFLAKFFELQGLMIRHNAGLTKAHPYQSTPETWPTLVRGISFWERKGPPTWRQIYLLGNPLAWWFAICGVGLYAVIWLLDQILLRKGVDEFGYIARRYFNRGVGYAFLAWVLHYVPFYVQGRSLFLHHYLPAYVFSCLTTAGSIEFLINVVPRMPALIYGRDGVKATDDEARSQFDDERKFELVRRSAFRTGRGWWMAVWALSAVFGLTFWYFAFLAYGDPVEDIEVIRRRQWIKTWDLQFI